MRTSHRQHGVPALAGALGLLLSLALAPLSASAQATNRISALTATNVAAASNLVPIVTNPNATNGTKVIRIENLFSNAVFWGSIGIGTNSPAARLHLQLQGSNAVLSITGITNAGPPATTTNANAWIPVSLNGTNGWIPFYK